MTDDFILNDAYDISLKSLRFALQKAEMTHKDKESVLLAKQLIEEAVLHDKKKVRALLSENYIGKIDRNFSDPISFTHPGVIDQAWGDATYHPLQDAEQWNKDRRASNTGIAYSLDGDQYPINPYCNYGIKGRGVIGLYGPNHAVDDGILKLRTNAHGKLALYALGIIRNDSGTPALCGGFTTFSKDESGAFPYTDAVKIDTQAHEFFEEMVSGSVTLMDQYTIGLQQEIADNIRERETIEGGPLTQGNIDVITAQLTTHRKVLQVQQEDPGFFARLRQSFQDAQPCYEGPMLSSARNTNTSWMETKLSYFIMDDDKWDWIKGNDAFGYQLTAGDDAGNVLWHEITPDLVRDAESHGALFTYLLSGYLLTSPPDDPSALKAVKNQAQELLAFFRGKPVQALMPAYTP